MMMIDKMVDKEERDTLKDKCHGVLRHTPCSEQYTYVISRVHMSCACETTASLERPYGLEAYEHFPIPVEGKIEARTTEKRAVSVDMVWSRG